MKRLLLHPKGLFALLIALFMGMGTVYAYDFYLDISTGQRLYYNITDHTNHYVELTYPGTLDHWWEGYSKPTGDIVLSASVSYNGVTYSVTAIGEQAFRDCTGLTGTLTIPNSVITIGDYAFAGCSGFTGALTLPYSLITIGEAAFQNCSGFSGSLFLKAVQTIGQSAFQGCSGFTGILSIRDYITTIAPYTFSGCSGFSSLAIREPVTSIGQCAFQGCSGLGGSLVLPNSLTTIGDYAFENCSNISGTLTIPRYVASIGNSAFKNCSGFARVNYRAENCADIAGVNFSPFEGCGGVIKFSNYIQRIPDYMFSNANFTGSLSIPDAVTSIGDFAFSDCYGFNESLTLGSAVTTIGMGAFLGCSGFTGSLSIPNSVTTINDWAFYYCDGFTGTLTLGNSVTTIGYSAFAHCNGFTGSLAISNSVVTIDDDAFAVCTGFTGLTLGSSVTTIGTRAFYGCNGFMGSLNIPNSVTSLGEKAFMNCNSFSGSLNLGSSLTTIGASAFRGCHGFTGMLILPDSVTSIGNYAFYSCDGFDGSLTIPNSVTTVGNHAFEDCQGFTGLLNIGTSVTTISEYAFAGCSGLSSAAISSSVTDIDDYAFAWCEGLTSLTVFPDTPPTLGDAVFQSVPTDIPVNVPCGSLEDYQAASGWSAFTNLQCYTETLTLYDGTETSTSIPAFILFFDDFTRSQFVIPAADLSEMVGSTIWGMTFYTTNQHVPYTTVSPADVYLMEVDYTEISAYEPKESATGVYSGFFNIVSAGSGGEMTINFTAPYTYQGGNLLVGIENAQNVDYQSICFYSQTVNGASIAGTTGSSTETIPAVQQNFIPKTTFTYTPSLNQPFNLTVDNITVNSADLHWTGNQYSYNVRYRTVPDGTWTMTTTTQRNGFIDGFEEGFDN